MQAKEPSSTRQEPPFATHTGGGADGDVAPADTVVIVGGGIIGSCSAYFLAKRFLMEEEEEGLRQEAEAAGEKPSEGRPEVSRARGSDTAAAPALVEKAKDPVVVVNQDESDPGRQQTSSVAQSASSLPGLDFVRSDPPLRRRRRRKIIVVERHDVAGCASGKAGGFLARGWGDNDPTRQLHHVSFDLHAALAKELDVQSYRKLVTLEVSNRPRKPRGRRSSDLAKKPRKEGADGGGMQELPTPRASPICPWLNGDKFQANTMDTTTAQVTPFEFTTKILRAARATGFVEVVRSRVVGITEEKSTGLDQDEGADNKASAFYEVQLEGSQKRIRAGAVVVAMGPWSVEAASWFPRMNVPMEGIYSTSIVFRDRPLAATALFCGEDDAGCRLEVYPRPKGEVYLCGLGGSKHIQAEALMGANCLAPSDVVPDARRVAAAEKSFEEMTIDSGAAKSVVQQACMRPCTADGLPIIGRIPGTRRAFVATGHNCWGILWGPATGLAMSELVTTGQAKTVDLSPFDPARFSDMDAE